jgi:hypothetical protein
MEERRRDIYQETSDHDIQIARERRKRSSHGRGIRKDDQENER